MRFVWMFPTGSGEVVCDRKAAAAAAEESEPLEGGRPRKACEAAAAALVLEERSRGMCWLVREAELPRRRENSFDMAGVWRMPYSLRVQ